MILRRQEAVQLLIVTVFICMYRFQLALQHSPITQRQILTACIFTEQELMQQVLCIHGTLAMDQQETVNILGIITRKEELIMFA